MLALEAKASLLIRPNPGVSIGSKCVRRERPERVALVPEEVGHRPPLFVVRSLPVFLAVGEELTIGGHQVG